jgi:glutathione S-transferase
MTDELVFYTNPMSRGRIVRWMLEEIGQPYRTELLDYGTSMKAPDYLAINPMGKVPAIRHGDTVVTEAGAICAYLADAFPQAGLAPPPGDRLRGPYYRWMFFAAGPVEAAVTNKAFGFEVPQERRATAGYGSFADVMDALESAVSGRDYLVGDSFTAADVYVGSQIGWGLMFGSIERRPAFEDYWQRIGARPAARRAQEIDDALIPAQPAPAAPT